MRGYSDFYEDLGARQSLAYSLMDRLTDLKIDFWDMALEEISDLVDVIVELDDKAKKEIWRLFELLGRRC